VAEYFDVGCSRRRRWPQRPQAAALLAAVADPHRGFDAVAVGEFERAFYAGQLSEIAAALAEHGVALWLPETDGPFDGADPSHQALMLLLGAQSRREVLRARCRVTAAMRVQTIEQGRYLGGRPPYGYQLVDAGPHPNANHARWGRRLQRLKPDPATAEHVRWMFAQRLTGQSVASIARALNDRGVPCPSTVDAARNRHRSAAGWSLRTVAAILANPRYTGRQVWNRQRSDHARSRDGSRVVHRWNPASEWVTSKARAHEPLVSEDEFRRAQQINAVPVARDGARRRYRFVGLLRCALCGRSLHSHWVHGRPGYRCRHGTTSARPKPNDRPRSIYLREDDLVARLVALVGERYPEPISVEQLARYVRDNHMMIICDGTTLRLDGEDVYSTQPALFAV
jgi:DNA invertase Pin-like site-specific DNA recombinase